MLEPDESALHTTLDANMANETTDVVDDPGNTIPGRHIFNLRPNPKPNDADVFRN